MLTYGTARYYIPRLAYWQRGDNEPRQCTNMQLYSQRAVLTALGNVQHYPNVVGSRIFTYTTLTLVPTSSRRLYFLPGKILRALRSRS